jgi:hypothetical protein
MKANITLLMMITFAFDTGPVVISFREDMFAKVP